MPTPPLTNELALEALNLVAEHGGNVKAASDASGIPYNTLFDRRRLAILRGLDQAIVHPAPQGHRIRGVSTLYDAGGNPLQQWVKTTAQQIELDEVVEHLKAAFEDLPRRPAVPKPARSDENLLAVYPLVDWHVGLLAWARETGVDYDLKIARKTIMNAMAAVISATPPAETGIVLGIGDMLHFDGYAPVTPRSGHQLDTDSRFPKILRTAADMVEETIELALGRHQRVIARILPGNHDPVSAVALSLALSRVFRGNKRVTIDESPSYYWWFRAGKVLLGATHGDRAKMKDLPLVMAHDRPDDWAASTYRRVFTGHIHHESKIEEGGVIVTSMRSPVARDAYHSFNKWRSGRSVYSETFNIDGGQAASMQINL